MIRDCSLSASLAFHSAYFSYTIEPLRRLNHPETNSTGWNLLSWTLKDTTCVRLISRVNEALRSDNVFCELLELCMVKQKCSLHDVGSFHVFVELFLKSFQCSRSSLIFLLQVAEKIPKIDIKH